MCIVAAAGLPHAKYTTRRDKETSRARESLLFRFSRAVRSRFHRTNMLRRPPATRSFDHGQHRPTGPGYIPATMHSGASNCRAGVQCIYSKPRAFFQKIGTWMAHFGKGGGQMEAYYVYGTPIHCGLQLEWWDLVNLKMPWTTLRCALAADAAPQLSRCASPPACAWPMWVAADVLPRGGC